MRKSISTRLGEIKSAAVQKINSITTWAKSHPQEAIVVAGICASIVGSITESIKAENKKKMEMRTLTTYYDPCTGIHWQLNKKPTNIQFEYIEVHKRYESMGTILRDLRLI
jgi:hypothetical protein